MAKRLIALGALFLGVGCGSPDTGVEGRAGSGGEARQSRNSGGSSTGGVGTGGSAAVPGTGGSAAASSSGGSASGGPKTPSGPIEASSGQVIENLHVENPLGRCITVPPGVTDVVIRDNEIGPCGADDGNVDTDGVRILEGARNVRIEHNVIHDVSSAITAYRSEHPIIVDHNFVYDIRGPFYRGQMIQMEEVSGGTSGSKITCNVADGTHGDLWRPEDVINLYSSPGLDAGENRTEIAFNRIRGASTISQNGSGIVLGDGSGGGNVWVHHNTIVDVVNLGIGIAGGVDITLEKNRIYMTGPKSALGMSVRNYSGHECSGHAVLDNRVFTLDYMYQGGVPMHFEDSGACGALVQSGNVWGDTSLSTAIFDDVPVECQ